VSEISIVWVSSLVSALAGAIVGALASGGVAWWLEKKRLAQDTNEARRRLAAALKAELELLSTAVEVAIRDEDALATMTTIATLRPAVAVYMGNTDKIGVFTSNITNDIIGSYVTIRHLIDRGDEMFQEHSRVERDPLRRETTLASLREDAASYVPGIKNWIKSTKNLKDRLDQILEM
jgi:hypothetical protein